MRQANVRNTDSTSLEGEEFQKTPGSIDYARIRELVSMEQVLELLNWQHGAKYGPQLRGPCPVHRSENPLSRSFSVHVERQVYRCFAACCSSKGNQLDLFAAATNQPLYDAAWDLCHRLKIAPPLLRRLP